MPTALLVSGIAAIILALLLLVFHQLLRRRYVRLLPGIYRSAVDRLLRNLSTVKSSGIEQVPIISSAFRNLNYEPLQRRWAQSFRDFEEISGSRVFLDVDEFFRMEPLLEEVLERRNANEAGKWLYLGGAFASSAVVALGFLLGQGAQFNPFNVIGMGVGVFSLAAAFALQYRYEDARMLEACMEDYLEMMARLKECLPPIGRNSLIQTLYLSQTEQAENLRKQTEQLQKSLSSFAVDTLTQHLGNIFHASIEQLLHPPIQKMADVQTTLLNRMERDQQHRLEQLFNLFTKEVGDLLGKQLGGMVDQVNRASGGMREIVTSLHTVAGEVGSTLSQNRETTVRNESLLEALNETHKKLMDRFNESTILLDDILNSSKLLAETTSTASVATLELAEQAGKVQQETGERFELLRTTLDERLSASTDAAVTMQTRLASHTETVMGQLAGHTDTITSQLASLTDSLIGKLVTHEEVLQTRQNTHAEALQTRQNSHEEALLAQQVRVQESLDTQLQSVNTMLTALSTQMRATFEEQAQTFSRQRTEEVQNLFAHLNEQVTGLQQQTVDMLEKAQAMNIETATRFGTEASALFEKFDKQNQSVAQELQAQGRTNAGLLALTNKTLAETSSAHIKAFTEQSERMSTAFEKQTAITAAAFENQTSVAVTAFDKQAIVTSTAFEQQSTQLVQAWKQNAEGFYDSLHSEARSLLQVLPTQMREAFDAFTSAMGETMRATLTDSVEIVDKLGERIQQLHSEFELYFSRTEGNTQTQISDMRFAMEGAIGKFSELSDASLTQLRDGNQEAMSAFSEQTRQLMESVDEQTRTISLYVKDMGIDMADLNKGLKESVAEFTSHLHNGVTDTFQEFDTGLAEIVRRMTELGVRIEEAVEALPESIGRLSEGR